MDFNDLFKNLIDGNSPISTLQKWIDLIEGGDADFIKTFLQNSSKCDEILALLQRGGSSSMDTATICSFLAHILESVASDKNNTSVGLHIVKELTQKYKFHLESLLKNTSSPACAVAGLRCLTGMAMLGSATTTQLMLQLNWTAIDFSHLAKQRATIKLRDVRSNLIQFFIICLQIDDSRCLEHFLKLSDALPSIFPGLLKDSSHIVIKVLNLLHNCVVLKGDISKTTKVKLFSITNCRPILNLYEWKGPENLKEKVKGHFSHTSSLTEEQKNIRETIHKLMTSLCSSHKYGFLFKSDNSHVFKVLSSVKSLWRIDEGKELIILIISSCPDLLNEFSKALRPDLDVSSENFVSAVDLSVRIFDSLDANIFVSNANSSTVIFNRIWSFSHSLLPDTVKKADLQICFSCLNLFLANLKKSKDVISHLESSLSIYLEQRESLVKDLLRKINLTCQIDFVNEIWSLAVKQLNTDESDYVDVSFKIVSLILQVMHIYFELFSIVKLIGRANWVNMPIKLLDICEKKTNLRENVYHDQAIINALKFFSQSINNESCKIESFDVGDIFSLISMTYINLESSDDASNNERYHVKKLIIDLLNDILIKYKLSPKGIPCCEIWLNSIVNSHDTSACEFFIDCLRISLKNINLYSDNIYNLSENTKYMRIKDTISLLETIETHSLEVSANWSIFAESPLPFSCLILGAVDMLKNLSKGSPARTYFSRVVDEYIYYLDKPEILAAFLLSSKVKLIPDTQRHMEMLTNCTSFNISITGEEKFEDKLKKVFISNEAPNISEFTEGMVVQPEKFQKVIAQIIHYMKKGNSSDNVLHLTKLNKFYIKLLKKILKQLKMEDDKIALLSLQYFLASPFVINSYNPFGEPESFNRLVEYSIKLISSKYSDYFKPLQPYFEKVLTGLKTAPNINDEFVASFEVYLACHKLWTFELLESTLKQTLAHIDPYSEALIKINIELVKMLHQYSCTNYSPSVDVIHLIFSKLNFLTQNEKHCEDLNILIEEMQKVLIANVDCHLSSKVTEEDLVSLIHPKSIHIELLGKFIDKSPDLGKKIYKLLETMTLEFPRHLSLIGCLLKKNPEFLPASSLLEIKRDLLNWAQSEESEENFVCQDIFRFMLQKNLIDKTDVADMCKLWTRNCLTGEMKQPPHHVLSLIPFFELCNENSATLNLLMWTVRKCYGKGKVSEGERHKYFCLIGEKISYFVDEVDAKHFLQEEINSDQIWLGFIRQVLKYSLNDSDCGPTLLKCLTSIVGKAYSLEMASKFNELMPVGTILQMLHSHSHFTSLLLEPEKSLSLKEQTLLLILRLLEVDPSLCEERHVPILLGAYHATRSSCDEVLLVILNLYEREGCMASYSPSLWGKPAYIHFSEEDSSTDFTMRQSPKFYQTLSLIEEEKLIRTSKNFDEDLPMEPSLTHLNDDGIYDQRYILNIIRHMTELRIRDNSIFDLLNKGGIAIAIAALSSSNFHVWSVGAAILRNVVKHLERVRVWNSKTPWIWLVASVGYSLQGEPKRLPSLIVHFFIEASRLTVNPNMSNAYKAVMNYLYIHPGISLYKLPEFYILFNAKDVEHYKDHQMFLLSLLSCGIKGKQDFRMCLKVQAPQLILSLFTSPTSTPKIKLLCIKALSSMLSLPEGRKHLLEEVKLVQILPSILKRNQPHREAAKRSNTWITALLQLMHKIWTIKRGEFLLKIGAVGKALDNLVLSSEEPDSDDRRIDKRKLSDTPRPSKRPKTSLINSADASLKEPENDEFAVDQELPNSEDLDPQKEESSPKKRKSLSVKGKKRHLQSLFASAYKIILEFCSCMSHVVPNVMCGDVEAVSQCFELICSISSTFDEIKIQSRSRGLANDSFQELNLRQMIRTWLNTEPLKQQLHKVLTPEDEFALTGVRSFKADWKKCSLSELSFANESNEKSELCDMELSSFRKLLQPLSLRVS